MVHKHIHILATQNTNINYFTSQLDRNTNYHFFRTGGISDVETSIFSKRQSE